MILRIVRVYADERNPEDYGTGLFSG